MTNDPIRDAFASLHADEVSRVAAPGVAAAFRTVRRRRHRFAGTAVGVVAMFLISAGYLVTAGSGMGPTGDPSPAPEAVAGDRPSLPPDDLDSWRYWPDGKDEWNDAASVVAEALWGGFERGPILIVAASPGHLEPNMVLASTFGGVDAGRYQVRVACAGAGSLVVTDLTGAGGPTDTVQCGSTTDEVAAGIGESTAIVPEVTMDARGRILPPEDFEVLSLTLDEAARAGITVVGFDLIPA